MSTHSNEENFDETMMNEESTAEDLAGCDDSGGIPADASADDEQNAAENNDLEEVNTEPEAESAELDIETEDLPAQLAEARDQLLRKAAEFENFRKRMNQEKQSAIEFANQSLLLDIIPIIDDFERAIQSAEASEELAELPAGKAMLEGIMMIEKRLTGQLESKWGLKRFNSAGEPFDPTIHEAMFVEKSPDIEEPVIMEDFIKGYTLKDRVIRAAKVKVLMPEDS
ncbi:MAG: nucleotide exchange factor GrpE [Treponema sp.]|nr:nucleotide exchange factor GrpE [Treponema sp.]